MQTINHPAHTVYDLQFREGKVISIRRWNIAIPEDISFMKRETYKRFADVFEETVVTLCHDRNFDNFAKLFDAMHDDEEYCNRARRVIAEELMCMAKQVERITRQYWLDYPK